MKQRTALAVILAAGIAAAGCGSETESATEDQPQATQAEAPKPAPKPKPKSARAQMIECIEGVTYSVTSDGPNNLSIKSPNGTLEAVAIIHPTAAKAEKSAAQGREEDGLDAVAYGRVELILHAAKGAEARVITGCVMDA